MPAPPRVVRPGGVNPAGDFFDPAGNLLTLVGRIQPGEAQELVAAGAQLAYEGCGCGGSAGCSPEWLAAEARAQIATQKPRFIKVYGSPTWIDCWSGDGGFVVYAHGDVAWGDVLG